MLQSLCLSAQQAVAYGSMVSDPGIERIRAAM
jgi:hypothetical protein